LGANHHPVDWGLRQRGAGWSGPRVARRRHPVHLLWAAVAAFGGANVLLLTARAGTPTLRTPDIDAWERSVDVDVKTFLPCRKPSA
jgi:hypothetical protein